MLSYKIIRLHKGGAWAVIQVNDKGELKVLETTQSRSEAQTLMNSYSRLALMTTDEIVKIKEVTG
jgi:hypothetical protein